MFRLNQRAFEILKTEVQRLGGTGDLASQVQREIALRRLEKLCAQKGIPLTYEELRETLIDLFPNFGEKSLKMAARANQTSAVALSLVKLKWVLALGLGVAGVAGVIWLLNLPTPLIRRTVAQAAPDLLMPSFFSMDYHYRQAIALVEQSDQLVNQATSAADLELGTQKVQAAQHHLDALPVWSLNYYPQRYCNWFQCTWRFTYDEFAAARKQIGRMDARLFQEKNAQTQLTQAEQALGDARQLYQEAPNSSEKETAIAQWQQAIDTLHQVPAATLAGRTAQSKLVAYERDFEKIVGWTAGKAQSGNLIQAAQEFAKYAQVAMGKPGTPHSVAEWDKIQQQWKDAIDYLKTIEVQDPDYNSAQKLLANYTNQLRTAGVKREVEQSSVQAYDNAQRLVEQWRREIPEKLPIVNRNWAISQVQAILRELRQVKPGTTVYQEAKELQGYAQKYQQRLQSLPVQQ